jgi:OOP family OmpA-OmpF porin
MNKRIVTVTALLGTLILSGCSTTGSPGLHPAVCAMIASTAAGGVDANDGQSTDSTAGAAVVGAAAGWLLCELTGQRDRDSDGDGVMDSADACPGTAAGTLVDARGCPRDSDGDGVVDGDDACPGTPRGTPVDARGCPRDEDRDGVIDPRDRCPGTPSGVSVDASGCPEVGETLIRLDNIEFALDSAELSPAARRELDRAAGLLESQSSVRVRVEGHTDSSGSEAYNQGLSERRARAVVDYLIGEGIAAGRLEARGFGESQPIADNDSEAGRARNRRVDFVIVD